MTTKDKYRQPAIITDTFYGKEDHGIITVNIIINYTDGGCTQGFGNLNLGSGKNNKKLSEQYISDICYTFGVSKLKDLLDKRCFALFNFGRYNETIEGLESFDTGLRFTHTGWRKKVLGKVDSPFEAEKKRIEESIERAKAGIERDKQRLASLSKEYKSWY